ncbi:MAG: hypothetical protein HQL83_17350 [Magnetococcales bacterium]|nr:hypothetical protein [Magnetococcales bacterium]
MKWSPSIHMPRKVSRIILEIVRVDVEQLQNITERNAIAEGIYKEIVCIGSQCSGNVINAYKDLWNSINAVHGYEWNTNPLVWVVEFRKITVETDAKTP